MANRARGECEIKLGGKVYRLAPSFDAISEIEDKAGIGIVGLSFQMSAGNIGIKNMTAILWGGMVGAESQGELTYREVGEMVRKAGVTNVLKAAAQFMKECLTGDEEDAQKAEEKPKALKGEEQGSEP